MSSYLYKLILTILFIALGGTFACNSENHTSSRGYIWLNTSHRLEPIRCEHNIIPPGNVTTTLRIDRFQGNIGDVKVVISGNSFASQDVHPIKRRKMPVYYKRISDGIKLQIFLSSWSHVELMMAYYFRNINESCRDVELECLDGSGCFSMLEICDGKFSCLDHSDETSCGRCPPGQTLCSNKSSTCFDPSVQRCDANIDCPAAEDEISCKDTCRDKIACSDPQMCFQSKQRCDGKNDCPDGYDESNCAEVVTIRRTCLKDERRCKNGICIPISKHEDDFEEDCNTVEVEESAESTIAITVLMGVLLSVVFLVLLFRCYTMRHNDVVDDIPESEMPVYSSEENGYDLQFTDADFMHGGEIYEAFVVSRKRQAQRRKKDKDQKLITKPYSAKKSKKTSDMGGNGDTSKESESANILGSNR